ncbi:hypothetical protein WJX73_000515 [Symbiochloris irregularis]|uniref:SGNH hydrolase-type esterase domain-containing protein n=1 Tax=Symbiochloris irregularis TaxID=706552 RepID=A0AAW1P0G8_9CHLO
MQWSLGLVLLACLCSQGVAQQLLASGRIAGRYDPVTGLATLPLVIDWPSTEVWAAFDSSDKIEVVFEKLPGDDSQVNCSLAFDLDGQTEVVYVTSDMLPYTWSKSGLSGGTHALEIFKRSETLYGILLLTSMTVSSSGRFVMPQIPTEISSGRRIMALGDSIASGWGDIGNSSCGQLTLAGIGMVLDPDTEDALLAFPTLVADHYDADRQILAWSGATQNPFPSNDSSQLAAVTTPTVPMLFEQLIAGNKSSLLVNASAWAPQLILMEGGINDFKSDDGVELTTPNDWADQYIRFIQKVQQTYPNPPEIVVTAFPINAAEVGILTTPQAETYISYMSNLGAEIGRRQLSDVHLLMLDGSGLPTDNWRAMF